jgi:ferredoxin
MRLCKICDARYVIDYMPAFPDEDYCRVCEIEIMVAISEMKEEKDYGVQGEGRDVRGGKRTMKERMMCTECGLKYFPREVPKDCGTVCPLKETIEWQLEEAKDDGSEDERR